ncbi:MAG TPA: DUF2784 family protein [Rhizomicrobium sp.]|nr:DUF2784 family protein [Rhizomicrobium sp.]
MERAQGSEVHPKGERDALGWACFVLHLALVAFAAAGWALPWRGALILYLCYIPLMYLQWQFNAGSCVLNNVENLMRSGRWRNPGNREEGAFIKTLVEDLTGLKLTKRQMNTVIYCLISIFWLLGAGHLAWQSQS